MTPPNLNVVILAAGQGKRMRSDLPKVLHPLAGRPMLAHVLDTARRLGATVLCVVYGHGGERVREALPADDVVWVRQERQLGTGHALLQALPRLDPRLPTLVLYGDVPLIDLGTLRRLIGEAAAGLALLTATRDEPHGYGRIVRVDGSIRRIVEEKDADDAERAIREINTDIVAMAVAEGLEVRSARPAHIWETEGINGKAQLAALERIYQGALAARLLDDGVTLADPARIDVRGELHCGRDVFIDVGCVFEGRVELGDGVVVGPNCVLRDSVVGAGARLAAFSHCDGARIGADGRVGPYARLRPGADLGADVHIGNFVEVKNTTIAAHSKANHLAYLGDATIGSRVNVGAGTITCNYDGANKHRTVIEDDVFIGSDSQLVAPVTVARGATLGAGTTLTRDAPAGQLTVSRAKQVSYPGWKRPVKDKS